MPGGLERDANTERKHEQGVHKMNAGGELAQHTGASILKLSGGGLQSGSNKERNQNAHTAAHFHPVAYT